LNNFCISDIDIGVFAMLCLSVEQKVEGMEDKFNRVDGGDVKFGGEELVIFP
jgi:hypothetical protein